MSIERVMAAERKVYALRQSLAPGRKVSKQTRIALLEAQRELDRAMLVQAELLEKQYPGDPMLAGYAAELRAKIREKTTRNTDR